MFLAFWPPLVFGNWLFVWIAIRHLWRRAPGKWPAAPGRVRPGRCEQLEAAGCGEWIGRGCHIQLALRERAQGVSCGERQEHSGRDSEPSEQDFDGREYCESVGHDCGHSWQGAEWGRCWFGPEWEHGCWVMHCSTVRLLMCDWRSFADMWQVFFGCRTNK